MGFPVALVVRSPPANVGDLRDMDWIPGSGRSPGGRRGNPLQCSCLENPVDRRAWWATIYRVAQSRTRLKRLSSSHDMTYILGASLWLQDWGHNSPGRRRCRVDQGGEPGGERVTFWVLGLRVELTSGMPAMRSSS